MLAKEWAALRPDEDAAPRTEWTGNLPRSECVRILRAERAKSLSFENFQALFLEVRRVAKN